MTGEVQNENPTLVTGPQGPKGDTGPAGPGPTAEQLAKAVADYLAVHPAPSQPGLSPTDEQVAAAVAAWFDKNPPKAGHDGAPGADVVGGSFASPDFQAAAGELDNLLRKSANEVGVVAELKRALHRFVEALLPKGGDHDAGA